MRRRWPSMNSNARRFIAAANAERRTQGAGEFGSLKAAERAVESFLCTDELKAREMIAGFLVCDVESFILTGLIRSSSLMTTKEDAASNASASEGGVGRLPSP
jgi:hypothetical protein